MFRRDLIQQISPSNELEDRYNHNNIELLSIIKLVIILCSDILLILFLILPEIVKPKSKLAIWLTRIFG